MAYFLPSYFQKRLLRYALARLDLIDTDAINLDDLDISLGQRSVIELKNIGIKVDRLIEKLKLPSTVTLKHAIIKQLRLTVPADLHVSGINVLVDGVEVEVEVEEQEAHTKHTGSASGQRNAANRSRLSSPPIHDPGGDRHVLPSSGDLAHSFLETESQQEKAQLEAALSSQSQYMSESATSLEDAGLGDPAGFSLPTFVADFFTGVANRLSVDIKNVRLVAGISLSSDPTPMDTVKIMVRLAEISLSGSETGEYPTDTRRIELSGFEILLMSEREAFSQHSMSSSPRLSKSRSKASSTLGSESFSQFESPEQRYAVRHPDQYIASSRTPSDMHLSPAATHSSVGETPSPDHAENSVLIGSQLFRSSTSNEDTPVSAHTFVATDGTSGDITSSRLATAPIHPLPGHLDEDDPGLSESKLFTHEEAESMYMSAISHGVGSSFMPGGWTAEHREPTEAAGRPQVQDPIEQSTLVSGSEDSPSHPQAHAHTSAAEPLNESTLIAKRLIEVDKITLIIPASINNVAEEQESPSLVRDSRGTPTRPTESAYHSVYDRGVTFPSAQKAEKSSASMLFQSTHARLSSRDFPSTENIDYSVAVGTISCYVDMSIARILVQASSTFQKLSASRLDEQRNEATVAPPFSLKVQIDSMQVSFCQSVPEADVNTSSRDSIPCLLQLSVSQVTHELVQSKGESRQKLTVSKIELGQGEDRVVYFVDSMNIQNSVATSVMIRPHDLVVMNLNDRFDVQFKPVQVVLDLLLVDDILSRGGGLDSLLDLGASSTSSGTVREPSRSTKSSVRPRSVRFDSQPTRPQSSDEDIEPGPKFDVKLSGASIDLVGSETSLQLKTTAIKVVSRSKKARVQIDKAVLVGPLVHGSQAAADINVKLENITIVYLDTPVEEDLERLLSLLTPSSDKYGDDDDIMVPTLVRQRRKGGVLRLSTTDVQVNVRGITWQRHVSRIGDELSRLSAVSKYLPEDDRPGVLTFALINKISVKVDMGRPFGVLQLNAALLEGALITVPSLMAAQVSNISLRRGEDDILLSEVIPNSQDSVLMGPPMLMCRFIADEMEPTVRVKLSNTQIEYKVSIVVAFTELWESLQKELSAAYHAAGAPEADVAQSPPETSDLVRRVRFSLTIRNSTIGLNPTNLAAKGLFLLSDAEIQYTPRTKKGMADIRFDLRKASVLIINDVEHIGHESSNVDHRLYFEENDQVQDLTKAGYVPVGSISNASATVTLSEDKPTGATLVDVEFRNNLFLLETCADSTQTLVQILSGLSPPAKPSPEVKYRTEIVSIQDMLSSFTGNAFVSEPGPELGLQASQVTTTTTRSTRDDDDETDQGYSDEEDEDEEDDEDNIGYGASELYPPREPHDSTEGLEDSYIDSEMSHSTMTGSIHVGPVSVTAEDDFGMADSVMAHSMLDFRTDHFVQESSVEGTAHRWDSTRNTYELGSEATVKLSPLKVRVREVHVIWNLFDGYDWQSTRDTISKAVEDIEAKAVSKQSRRDGQRLSGIEDDESVIGDFLFNSIYIGIPANRDPKDLTSAINQEIDDLASETGSYATGTTVTATPSGRMPAPRGRQKKLRLSRSKQHKMTFELKGISADVLAFPPESGEVQSSIDVRVKMLEIFDHVPTSTWKKFATYMHEAGEREVDTSMIHLELLNVKPIADLSASEIVLKLTVLPLRLHVDQDALDFMTRFFEFKDETQSGPSTPSVPPFIQRAEVNPIRLRLDYKPKRVDYAALRSGRTGEFKNFFTLDRSNMVLRRVILYGVSGFDRLGLMLNDIWTPDVQRNQLPGVLAGLAPIRSLVDVGSGVRDLVAVPIREYKKDGRIVRSIQKGALAFAKTTTTELVNLGAKLAIGTQTVLQGAEGMLAPREHDADAESKEQISLYADQPLGIVQGLRGAYASLERDLLLAKDAIVAVPGEVMASGSATEAAKAVLKQSPTIILRPAIGASKAVGQTLLGAGNSLDRKNRRRIEDKYKRH